LFFYIYSGAKLATHNTTVKQHMPTSMHIVDVNGIFSHFNSIFIQSLLLHPISGFLFIIHRRHLASSSQEYLEFLNLL
jgi:hypothetical protein